MANLDPLFSTGKDDWCTPQNVIDAILEFWGEIDLDPCSNPQSIVPAKHKIMLPEDGLSVPWAGRVFINPPYGREMPLWLDKASMNPRGSECIMLIPARTDTKAWQKAGPDAVCFWAGRLKFLGAPSSAPFPSALLYWGGRAMMKTRSFCHHFWKYGQVWD